MHAPVRIALPNFRQGNFGHPGQSMHASDPCNAEIQNHPEKINYHHRFLIQAKGFGQYTILTHFVQNSPALPYRAFFRNFSVLGGGRIGGLERCSW